MTTMFEKMARAMYEARPGEFTGEAAVSWDAEYPDTKETLRVLARAALTAMLEPSPMVIDKGIDALDDCVDSDFSSNADGERDYYTSIRSDAAAVTFAAMIQAALDE